MWMQALKMLHKKVYPEEITEKQFDNIQKSEKRGMHENEMVSQPANKKSEKSTKKLSSSDICSGSTTNGGHWIKTDSDCKYCNK